MLKSLADTDGLIREEAPRSTSLPSFLTANSSLANSQTQQPTTEEAKPEQDPNVPDDIANFYQVRFHCVVFRWKDLIIFRSEGLLFYLPRLVNVNKIQYLKNESIPKKV